MVKQDEQFLEEVLMNNISNARVFRHADAWATVWSTEQNWCEDFYVPLVEDLFPKSKLIVT